MNVIQRDKVIAFLTSILVFSLVIFGLVNSSLASSTVKNAKMPLPPLRKLKQLLQNPSFEHTWRPKGSSDDEGSSFTLSGTNLDNWQSFRVGHAPLAKPFVSHSGNVALRMDRSGEGLGVMQHVEIRSEKPAKVILTAWVAGEQLENPPSISIDVNYMDGTFSLNHKIVPNKGTYGWKKEYLVVPATRPVRSVVVNLVVDTKEMSYDEALYIDDVELYVMEQDKADKFAEESDSEEHDGVQFHPPHCPEKHRCWNDIAFGLNMNFLTPSSKRKSNSKNIAGNGKVATRGVTLATQLSVDRLPLLCKSSEAWNAPVSASVYVRSGLDVAKLAKWRRKCKSIKKFVSFHLVTQPNIARSIPYPVNILRNVAMDGVQTTYVFNVDVDFVPNIDAVEHIMTLTDAMPQAIGKDQNYMLVIPAFEFVSGAQQRDDVSNGSDRIEGASKGNSKKYTCNTNKNTIVQHGDTLGRIARMYKVTVRAIHQCNPHIVDTELEIGDSIKIPKIVEKTDGDNFFTNSEEVPKNKVELLELIEQNKLQPVHADKFAGAHQITNYRKWYTQSERKPYQVVFKGVYEPYMVGPRSMPRFDERFAGYGMDKVELNYELHLAKYMLLVAPNAFVVHHNHPKATWGLESDLVRVYKNWYAFVYGKDKFYGHGNFYEGEKVDTNAVLVV
eukprot:g5215.t1